MIHFNELKANARSLYDTFKKTTPDYESAINLAITAVCTPFSHEQILLPGKAFTSMDEVQDFIRQELDEEVNLVVEIENHYSLSDSEGHIDWYRPKKAADKINFRFWSRYRKYLTHIKGWADTSVDKIDAITDEIMEDIEDPTVSNRPFDRRGLVVGYVQSGKTANFMGLVNKSIDSGYRVIVVLAGMQESLRQQTQERIDEEVIGRDTSQKPGVVKKIGVATLPGESYIPIDYLTESNFDPSKKGDFNIRKSHGTPPTADRPIIFIVKKNKSILENLVKYFEGWIETFDDNLTYKTADVKQFNNLPLLVIDDEADQASINTKKISNSDGDELDPTAINNCIRRILNLFQQKAYIGYTATPFANIFIRHNINHSVLGRDLFPSAFIKTLGTPSNYFGPKEVFGLNNNENENGLPLCRPVLDAGQSKEEAARDDSAFVPVGHKIGDIPSELPDSLRMALKAFIISSAIRWKRGQESRHNTMLIHCTRFNPVQNRIAALVDIEMEILRNAILGGDADILNELEELFITDFYPTSEEMNRDAGSWSDLLSFLPKAVRKIEPKCLIINGTVGDILDYKNKAKTGLSVIAVGGEKLSRGLTLEGLTISYFTRTTSLYDTLMQMGRWFGYRNGFEDLCRIYTTPDLFTWYRHIATAFEALREEFIEMSRLKLTPEDFGLRVQDHPDLMVTSVIKMRAAGQMKLNYQGTLTETSTLPSSEEILESNYKAARDFVISLGEPDKNFGSRIVWLGVPVAQIREFLRDYRTYRGLPAANSKRINEYIGIQTTKDNPEFTEWDVSLASLSRKTSGSIIFPFAGFDINAYSRSVKEERKDSFFIKRIVDPKDEFADFTDTEKAVIDDNSITNKNARNHTPRKQRPLLIIYVLNLTDVKTEENLPFEYQPVGFAVSWSASETTIPIDYKINSVYSELEINEYD